MPTTQPPARPAPEPVLRTGSSDAPGSVFGSALARGARQTLAEQLAERYAERIRQRLLAPGARLPSVRESARRHGLSPSTVVDAYERLQAHGLVQARPQRGYFVRDTPRGASGDLAGAPAGRPGLDAAHAPAGGGARAAHAPAGDSRAPRPAPVLPAPVDATALIRSMFLAQGGLPAPGMGTLPEAWLDAPLLQRALRRVCAEPSAWLRYGEPAGDSRLREALARRLADIGIAARPAQIVTAVGATQALDIVARTLLRPGDAVLVDEPGWAIEYARLSALGMRLLPVPRGAEGPDLAVMEALAREHRPRLYVTVSVLHNPTGQSLSASAAHRVLKLAEALDFLLVEDDSYAWLASPHAPRLAQLDALARTIYVSGFSKILAPQWRVGFLAATPALAERFVDTKLIGTLSSPGPLERALALCLESGALRRHAERMGTQLAAARTRTSRLVLDAGCRFVTPPSGLFGWIDTGVDTERLAIALLDDGWLTAPGSLFHPRPRPGTLMRVNFATSQDARFWRRLRQLRHEFTAAHS